MADTPALAAAATMHADRSVLVLVDHQSRLMHAIHEGEQVSARASLLAQGARLLGVPIIGTEQNPDRLGPNVAEVKALCDVTLAKTHFDACADGLLEAIEAARPDGTDLVIAGCEAHVCLLQTVLGVRRARPTWRVWVVTNASGSRRASDHMAAMARMAQAGATLVTHEMVLFEWLADCRHARFREALALIKASG